MSEGVARIRIKDHSMMVFKPRSDAFFIEGTPVKCILLTGDLYATQKFSLSSGLFEGWTFYDEDGNKLEERRFTEEMVSLSEFDVTIRGKKVNDATCIELVSLL